MLLQHVGENDEMSEVSSGLGASTVDSRHHEQDLAGFPEVEHSRNSVTAHVADSVREGADVPAALVHSPSKFAARESSGEAQAIGTSVHPTSEDMQTVSTHLGYHVWKHFCIHVRRLCLTAMLLTVASIQILRRCI